MEKKKLYKSRTNKKISGVCGGFGEYLGVDPTIIRLAWFAFSFYFGVGLVAYGVCDMVMRKEPKIKKIKSGNEQEKEGN